MRFGKVAGLAAMALQVGVFGATARGGDKGAGPATGKTVEPVLIEAMDKELEPGDGVAGRGVTGGGGEGRSGAEAILYELCGVRCGERVR